MIRQAISLWTTLLMLICGGYSTLMNSINPRLHNPILTDCLHLPFLMLILGVRPIPMDVSQMHSLAISSLEFPHVDMWGPT